MNFSTQFTVHQKAARHPKEPGKPLRVLIVGDYSGRGSRGQHDGFCMGNKKIVAVDKDNFDDVFAATGVEIQTPFAQATLRFGEMEDLHPDYLYQQLPLFEQFRTAIYRLGKCTSHEQAQIILKEFGFSPGNTEQDEASSDAGANVSLEALLESTRVQNSSSASFDVQSIIKEIVRPYAIPAADSGVASAEAVVWLALQDALRSLMQHASFKGLESIWRALDMVNRRLDTDSTFKLNILDATELEVRQVLRDSEQAQGLVSLLAQRAPNVAREPLDIILLNSSVGEGELSIDDARALNHILNPVCGQVFVGLAADYCEKILKNEQQILAASEQTDGPIFFAPRVLLRMPYGSHTAGIESFHFEEVPRHADTHNYLWGSGAYLGLLALRSWAENGAQHPVEVSGLPFVAVPSDDEPLVQPGVESVYSERQAQALAAAGVCVTLGSLHSPDVMVSALEA